jgi:branched-chain amino acid transport system substrate-binding protein
MKASVRTAAVRASVGLLAFGLAACGGSDVGTGQSEEITLGLLGPLSGVMAEIGENQVAGAQVAVAEINADGGIDGKKVKLVTRDEGLSPAKAAAAIRDMANEGVSLQLGMLSSADCLAIAPTLPNLQVVMVASGCTNDGLTGQDGGAAPYKNFFRVGTTDSALVKNLAKVVAEKFPEVTGYSAFGYDYVTGTSQWELYQQTLKAEGVPINVKKESFVSFDEQNFKPYVQALASATGELDKSALYLGTYGAGTVSFLQQAQDLDLASKYKLLVQPGGYYPVARALGGRAPRMWNAYDYSYAAFDNEMNAGFVEAFEEKTGNKPISWSYDAYLAVYAYKAAIEKAGSAEYEQVLEALPGIEFQSPAGELTINATTHQANSPVVVTHSVGDPEAPEDVKILETIVVEPEG